MAIRLRTRLWVTLFALVGVLAATVAVALVTLRRVAEADGAAAAADHAKHTGHRTAALVRDLYIHQTHVSIGGDASHVEHYTPLVAEAHAAASALRSEADRIGLGETAAPVDGLIDRIDTEFRTRTLPATAKGDRAGISASHGAIEKLVDDAVARIEGLNRRLEERADAARVAATVAGRDATIAILAALGLAGALALVLGARLARSITRPLDRLRGAAARLAAGDRSSRVEPVGDRELIDLAESFNRMAADVARHERRLVEARKLAAVGELAAGVAHEINNPLTVVLGRARLLRASADGELDRQRLGAELDAIAVEAEQCHRIVADLLSLGQRRPLRPEPVAIGPLLAEAALHARATARRPEGEEVDLSVAPTDAVPPPVVDPVRLRQIADNLLRNAVEACTRRVEVRAGVANETLRIEVEDDGPGVSDADLARVFEPFFTRKTTGSGLGLAISQAAARAMGGELEVGRGSLGGARFVLALPLVAPEGVDPAQPQEENG